jgi:hypothetical protein
MTSSIASPSPASSSTRPSVPVPYRAGEPPYIGLSITSLRDPDAPGPTIYVSLIGDSGASVSVLGKERLRSLGIRQRGAQAEIRARPGAGLAGRRGFLRSFVVTFVEDADAPSYVLTQR